MMIIGIDPGSSHSGVCVIQTGDIKRPNIIRADKVANDKLIQMRETYWLTSSRIAIEGFACQGRPYLIYGPLKQRIEMRQETFTTQRECFYE